ncbi:hypothetical protein [Saccharopolyspora shandongensis]|uniref:hypothetical protein n=1 Tax=Saccharopolyspora shandongensis TaxID=418495 RepID=UPI0033CD29C9
MTMFSEAQFRAVIDRLTAGTEELTGQIAQIGPAAAAAIQAGWVPQPVKDAIAWCAELLEEAATAVCEVIVDLLKAAVAPILMYVRAWEWQSLRGRASSVAGRLTPEALIADDKWHGAAADAYTAAIKPQGQAATRIGTIAGKTAGALALCASAGVAFYVSLGFILAKYIQTMVAAIAAFESAVFSWAGAILVVEETTVGGGLITAAVGALATVVATQAAEMVALHGEAVDGTDFPLGAWPDPARNPFADATVSDGDADWSLG